MGIAGRRRCRWNRLRHFRLARNQGLSLELVREQFGRLGNTPYALGEVTLDVEGGPFVQASLLNQLRREAVERLQELQTARRARLRFGIPWRLWLLLVRGLRGHRMPRLDAADSFAGANSGAVGGGACAEAPASITLDYLDLYGLRPSMERVKKAGIPARVASPRVLKPGEGRIVNFLKSLECQILVRATGILRTLASEPGLVLIGDFSLNAANSISAAEYFRRGISRLTPTHDLNAAQVADLARDVRRGPDGGDCVSASAGVSYGALRFLPVPFDGHEL